MNNETVNKNIKKCIMSQNKYLGLSPIFKITKKHIRPSGVHNARFFPIQNYMNTFKGGVVSHIQDL